MCFVVEEEVLHRVDNPMAAVVAVVAAVVDVMVDSGKVVEQMAHEEPYYIHILVTYHYTQTLL